jgi:hypothetical protein
MDVQPRHVVTAWHLAMVLIAEQHGAAQGGRDGLGGTPRETFACRGHAGPGGVARRVSSSLRDGRAHVSVLMLEGARAASGARSQRTVLGRTCRIGHVWVVASALVGLEVVGRRRARVRHRARARQRAEVLGVTVGHPDDVRVDRHEPTRRLLPTVATFGAHAEHDLGQSPKVFSEPSTRRAQGPPRSARR